MQHQFAISEPKSLMSKTNNISVDTEAEASLNVNESKTDIEINEHATAILRDVTEEISEALYSPKSGKLTIAWSTDKEFNAGAYSAIHPSAGPEHKIVINYTIAIELYRYAEKLFKFTQSDKLKNYLERYPEDYMPLPLIPLSTPGSQFINNMFMGALTWVFFHELGHAAQDHGVIRKNNCETVCNLTSSANNDPVHDDEYSYTQEVNAQADKKLSHQDSLIHHITELAADSEATCLAVHDLLRHAVPAEDWDNGLKDFSKLNWQFIVDNCYLMIAGIACTFFRFNNGRATPEQASATGSHPNAFFRMEMTVRQICRQLKFVAMGAGHEITDREILIIAKQAADLSALFWYYEISDQAMPMEDLLIRGLTERPEFKSYTAEIINAWDDLTPQILEVRSFGSKLGILHFDEEHREYIFGRDNLRD
ncbi:hypothetical protein [Pseudomonas sp. B21-053]|jgi:hypothetical protein|uniref:hypothetical protein n=1 Tax=Pseudomonas sp. B21-053 TaxID=2895493 RepID=UPI0022313925|nr:hypothetical protein [Pseudomonas sp. B21-053]UZE14544.1 hypothetical protein LOY68_13375 [Pseudomonas sp. B21-053]